MRPSNKSRSRSKPSNMGGGNPNSGGNPNNRQRLGNIVNRVFESAGPDGKVRGTPQQIIDKYQALARDAQLSGDRVAEQSFMQHSEHYTRMLGEAQAAQDSARQGYERDDRDDRREDGQRGDAPRTEGQRGEGQRGEGYGDRSRRENREPREQRQPSGFQPQPAIASSLATIDTSDGDEDDDLIYTPESGEGYGATPQASFASPAPALRAEPAPAPQPDPAPQPGVASRVEPAPGGQAPAAEAEPAPKPKRGRPRRKAPAAEEAADAPAPAEASSE